MTLSNRTILKPINVWSKIIVKANSWNSNFKGISWISCWLQVVRYGHFLREGLKSYLMVPISLLSMYVKGCTFDVNKSIDYRRADGSFLMSPRGLAVSSTRYISSHETRANASIRGWKLHLSESTWCQESVGGICFTNKWRAASQQPLTLSNDGESSVISNASPGLTVCFFFFFGVNIGVFWKRESRPIEWRQCASQLANFFFVCTSIVYEQKCPRATSRCWRCQVLAIHKSLLKKKEFQEAIPRLFS